LKSMSEMSHRADRIDDALNSEGEGGRKKRDFKIFTSNLEARENESQSGG
jgi:hypothetical protein